jgi:hypothetical protein
MLLKLLAASGAAFLGYKLIQRKGKSANAAFSADQPHERHTDVRDAGPEAMRDTPQREWTEVDEDIDESFPASDPPGGY